MSEAPGKQLALAWTPARQSTQLQHLSPLAPRGPSYGLQPGLMLTCWVTLDTSPHISGPHLGNGGVDPSPRGLL